MSHSFLISEQKRASKMVGHMPFFPVLESSPYSFMLASKTVQQWVAQCCVHAWPMLWTTSEQRLPLSVEHYITSKLFSLVYPLLIAAGVVTVL